MNIALTFPCLLAAALLLPPPGAAEPIAVHYPEGTIHGFLNLRTLAGKTMASGDLIQTIREDRVTSHLIFRFKDGSVDDETSVFTQRGEFRLISDRHIQKGPVFPHPMDLSIDVPTGQITARSTENGKEKVQTEHFDLPPDVANGIILNVLKNIRPETSDTKLSYIAADPKPRLVKLSITPQGEEIFSVAGAHHKAVRFLLKVELGGISGIIAPLVGKGPPNIYIWVLGGEAPAFVKLQGPLYLGGPVWTIEMTSPVWPRASHPRP